MEIIKPNNIVSKECVPQNFDRIKNWAEGMIKLCHIPLGRKSGALAIAHCQVTDSAPLRFFVTKDGGIFINPVITRFTKSTVDSVEGCMSFANEPDITVQRHNKVTVEWLDENFKKHTETFNGKMSKIFQHEIQHFDGGNIYGR